MLILLLDMAIVIVLNIGKFLVLTIDLVQKNFVQVVRAIELALGMPVPGTTTKLTHSPANITAAITQAASLAVFSPEVGSVLMDSMPIILKLAMQLGLNGSLDMFPNLDRDPITTRYTFGLLAEICAHSYLSFMDINWQFNNPSNPHDAALGPQSYDNHLYYSYVPVALIEASLIDTCVDF